MRYGLALGSNVGDRRTQMRLAKELLRRESPDPGSMKCAGLYETAPVGCEPGTTPFLNSCLELELEMTPREALTLARAIESQLGRPAGRARNAPRTIDIDLLYAGDLAIAEPGLDIPHPRLSQRRFVLEPLREICPDRVLPGETRTVAELCIALASQEPPLILVAREW